MQQSDNATPSIRRNVGRKRTNVGKVIWNRENLAAVAAQYATRGEMRAGAYGAYQAAARNGWWDLLPPARRRRIWTRESAAAEATQYATRADMLRGNQSLYRSILYHGWHDLLPPLINPVED
jgi:hypothetical protein